MMQSRPIVAGPRTWTLSQTDVPGADSTTPCSTSAVGWMRMAVPLMPAGAPGDARCGAVAHAHHVDLTQPPECERAVGGLDRGDRPQALAGADPRPAPAGARRSAKQPTSGGGRRSCRSRRRSAPGRLPALDAGRALPADLDRALRAVDRDVAVARPVARLQLTVDASDEALARARPGSSPSPRRPIFCSGFRRVAMHARHRAEQVRRRCRRRGSRCR